jgi:hypothetical protein
MNNMIHITILGCQTTSTEINIKTTIMAEDGFFNIRSTHSNEHLVFAETLRDWRDPLLQGYKPLPVLLCPRCATCKCASLKDFRHHSIHHSSCPHFHHHFRQTKSSIKRRSVSYDPSIIKSKSTAHSIKRKTSTSKIPVRISTSIIDYSPISIRTSNKKTKIPRLILTRSLPSPVIPTKDLYDTDR